MKLYSVRSTQVVLSVVLAGVLLGCGSSNDTPNTPSKPNTTEDSKVVVKPKKLLNASFDEIGKKKIKASEIKALNYDDDVQKMATQWDSEDAKDNYIRGFAYKDGKLAVASVYHSALVVFDGNTHAFSPFAALEGAAHGKEGTSVDGVTSASENWLNQIEFDKSGSYLYALVKPKYIGRFKEGKNPDKASYGLYKVQVGEDLKVDYKKAKTFVNKQMFSFDTFKDGRILTHNNETGDFFIYDTNLNEQKTFKIPNSFRYDLKNDKLVVLVHDREAKKAYVQQFNPENGEAIGEKKEYNYIFDTYSLFELTNKGDKLLTYQIDKEDDEKQEFCSYDITNFTSNCTDFGKRLNSAVGVVSFDDKLVALTRGKYNSEVNIINIENKPFIQSQIPSSGVSYGINFINNDTLVVAHERREIKEYKLSQSSEVFTVDEKFNNVSNKIFKVASANLNQIEVYERVKHGKKSISGDLKLPTNVDGVNVTWSLSKNFKEYVSEAGKLIKVPTQKISGTLTAKLQMLKDGKSIKEVSKETQISLVPRQ